MSTRKPYQWMTRVRFVDTDASQRIHYTAMFKHFEAAEMEFLRELNVSYNDPEFRDVGFPRVHVECDFVSELKFDDPVAIEVTLERIGASSYTLGFAASVEGRPAAKGKITVVCIDKVTQRSCPIPKRLAAILRSQIG